MYIYNDLPSDVQKVIDQINLDFPFKIKCYSNPGQADAIFDWLLENVGQLDAEWTCYDDKILFKNENDLTLYKITWGTF